MKIDYPFVKVPMVFPFVSLLTACATSGTATSDISNSTATPEVLASPTPVFSEEIIDNQGIAMRLVPAGEFWMGSDLEENQKPMHTIYLDTYYIDKYEVTNKAYQKCVDSGACQPPNHKYSATRKEYYDKHEFSNYPVIYVTWEMANLYCQWRDTSLPTEAEWEKAARGTDTRIYPWGNEFGCSYANMVIRGEQCVGDTTVVGRYETGISSYGLYDMAGNVGEWTSSILMPYPYDPNDGREDPSIFINHIVRGGTWYYEDETLSRVTRRDALPTMMNDPDIGFRCVREVTP